MAPSKESTVLKELFQTISANFPPSDGDNVWLERALYDQVSTASTEPKGVSYADKTTSSGVPYLWITPPEVSDKQVLLFMHGGGFSFGSPGGSHRKLAGHLALACGMPAASVDYRLTPQHPHPAAIEDCIDVYQHLISTLQISGSDVVLCGDSCGGGLASSVPLALAQKNLPKPGATVALSPWYDHTNSGTTRETNKDKDAMTQKPFSDKLATRYHAGKTAIDDPLVSPLFASQEQMKKAMPPHWVSVAGDDTLRCDGEEMVRKLKEVGVDAVLDVGKGMQHVYEFMAGRAPEADESVRKIGEWVKKTLRS